MSWRNVGGNNRLEKGVFLNFLVLSFSFSLWAMPTLLLGFIGHFFFEKNFTIVH
ncbi:hypothetical protein IQ249_16425 [Lusitaniella coriacea LEGE 07157]|uniref:Uncharacterized protein n=1 Tax=Lusitaniella coriacea LEGE 07157 TaxID=945747 RepID=A0A8J7DXW1_9CYAN|nr:hypothetical protein [Lusitaniella coriacea]MBE9117487.1 hypothetical protein [Lusitaniella coriacea LEGE 07157]